MVQAATFDMARTDNTSLSYWGQGGQGEPDLIDICHKQTYDTVILAFITTYAGSPGSLTYSFGNDCSQAEIDGCAKLGEAIQTCQKNGKLVTVSVGGADSSISLSSDEVAEKFGETVYNLFLGGKDQSRPFGDGVVLDGIDLDIEGGSTEHFPAFVNHMWEYAKEQGDTKKYYLTGAPQCPFPDHVLNQAHFDAVYVQFYNNEEWPCGLLVDDPQYGWKTFNFDTWNTWALNTSLNYDVKIYIGAPASAQAGNYYADAHTLAKVIDAAQKNYSSYGGVMMWDAAAAQVVGWGWRIGTTFFSHLQRLQNSHVRLAFFQFYGDKYGDGHEHRHGR
ncbi:glycoside hydrolase [Dichomitus squalens]|uniref:chitinase n=1 Tax=Dichomitus squalens TaxID=114155 RepID=A0A4V2JZC9_9APHY|nr:glycoside hydrolase [Dichomitus squalens]